MNIRHAVHNAGAGTALNKEAARGSNRCAAVVQLHSGFVDRLLVGGFLAALRLFSQFSSGGGKDVERW